MRTAIRSSSLSYKTESVLLVVYLFSLWSSPVGAQDANPRLLMQTYEQKQEADKEAALLQKAEVEAHLNRVMAVLNAPGERSEAAIGLLQRAIDKDRQAIAKLDERIQADDRELSSIVTPRVSGTVQMKTSTGWTKFDPYGGLKPGDIVRTGADGRMEFESHALRYHVGPNTSLIYDGKTIRVPAASRGAVEFEGHGCRFILNPGESFTPNPDLEQHQFDSGCPPVTAIGVRG